MARVGRYTAALLLISIGVALMVDRAQDSAYLELFVTWWPIFLIVLGTEYLLFAIWGHWKEKSVRLEKGTIIGTAIIAFVVITVMGSGDIVSRLGIHIALPDARLSGEDGMRFERSESIDPRQAKTFFLENRYGNVDVKSGNVKEIEIDMTVYVSRTDEAEARRIFDQTRVDTKREDGIEAAVIPEKYQVSGRKWSPRIDLAVTVPLDLAWDELEFHLAQGSVHADDLAVENRLVLETFNGSVRFSDIRGSVDAKTLNGSVEGIRVSGNVDADTTNGKVELLQIEGDASADTVNGAIRLEDVKGRLEADTVNGKMTVAGSSVGGDWEIDGVNSSVEVTLPSSGDYRIVTEKRTDSEIPLETVDGRKETIVGSGKYAVQIDVANGSVRINSGS